MNEQDLLLIMSQLLSLLEYFELSGIVHRNLEPRNILVIKDKDDGMQTVKICDFSNAKIIKPTEKINKNEFYGNIPYVSPEMCSRVDYGKETDMWSLGIIFYELMS